MAANIFKFLNDYVAVYQPKLTTNSDTESFNHQHPNIDTSFTVDKMSYKDFYEMVQDLSEHEPVVEEHIEVNDLNFYKERVEKYRILMDKMNYNRLPLNLKQYSIKDDTLFLTVQFGSPKGYFMDRVFDSELEYVNKPIDNKGVYIVVLEVGFTKRINEKSVPRPNKLVCVSVTRKNVTIVNQKSQIELEDVPYLQEKLQAHLDETINNKKGSKINAVKDALLNQNLGVESVLRMVSEKDLENTKFNIRMKKSIAERKPFDWKGLTH